MPNTSGNPAFGSTINVGRKALAVYGGSVKLFGQPPATPFTKLAATTEDGDNSIVVQGDVRATAGRSGWKTGDVLAVSRFHPNAFEEGSSPNDGASVVSVQSVQYSAATRTTTVTLLNPLQHPHVVREHVVSVAQVGGGRRSTTVVMAPVVAHLSRAIIISGADVSTTASPSMRQSMSTDDEEHDEDLEGGDDEGSSDAGTMPTTPYTALDTWLDGNLATGAGGHVVVMHSAERQVVTGVEFVALGVPGVTGRYPFHMHFLGDLSRSGTTIDGNVIHHSKQRAVVVHATHHARVSDTVAFRVAGHAFMVEDGIEKRTAFVHNLGMSIRPAIKRIADSGPDIQSDDTPAAFWMATPDVDLIGNVAAGSLSFGYWFESFDFPRGASRNAKLPGYDTVRIPFVPFGTVRENEAFATSVGFASYPEPNFAPDGNTARFDGLFCWSVDFGWQINEGRNQVVRNAVFVDVFEQGVHSNRVENWGMENSVIVGMLHPNGVEGTTCDPADDFGNSEYTGILFETRFEVSELAELGLGHIHLKNVSISNFNSRSGCRPGSALRINAAVSTQYMPPGTVFDGVDVAHDVDRPLHISYSVQTTKQIAFRSVRSQALLGLPSTGSNANMDVFAVSKGFFGEDVLAASSCTSVPATSVNEDNLLYACPNQCWRVVALMYDDLTEEDDEGMNLVDGSRDTTLRITHATLGSFEDSAEHQPVEVDGTGYNRVFNKVMPAGMYEVSVLNPDRTLATDIDASNVVFVRPDVHASRVPPCAQDVSFSMNGVTLTETVLVNDGRRRQNVNSEEI